jgi:hypothetical protein
VVKSRWSAVGQGVGFIHIGRVVKLGHVDELDELKQFPDVLQCLLALKPGLDRDEEPQTTDQGDQDVETGVCGLEKIGDGAEFQVRVDQVRLDMVDDLPKPQSTEDAR